MQHLPLKELVNKHKHAVTDFMICDQSVFVHQRICPSRGHTATFGCKVYVHILLASLTFICVHDLTMCLQMFPR